jgi:nickel/cobalt exporter
MRNLAAEVRSGGLGGLALAVALGALHALTPGHGKVALTAYFLGKDGNLATGMRVALSAALFHVVSGFCVFLVLTFIVGLSPSLSGRGASWFTVFGYSLIVFAGLIMFWQSFRPSHEHSHGSGTITAEIGLLPCPLTISVLGFARIQGTTAMAGFILIALTRGIATTIVLLPWPQSCRGTSSERCSALTLGIGRWGGWSRALQEPRSLPLACIR